MIRGNIAIPDRDPKTSRARGKKRKQPAIASAIVTPAPMKKRRLSSNGWEIADDGQEQPRRSAMVEPKRKPRTTLIFGPVPDDYEPEAHRRLVRRPTSCSARSCAALPSVTDDLPTARNTLPKDPWLCLFVWCKACFHRARRPASHHRCWPG
jgi:hypothetical protein